MAHFVTCRHCLMLRRCLNTPNPCFGMLPPIPPQPNRQGSQAQGGDYGTMLEIRSVQTLPDGRMIVETFGTWRFRVMERGTLDGYIVGRVERVDDDEEDIEDVPGGEELEGEVTEAASASAEPAAGDGRSRPTALSGIAGKRATIEELMATCQTFLEELQAGTPWLVQQLNNYTPMPEDPAIFSFWVALVSLQTSYNVSECVNGACSFCRYLTTRKSNSSRFARPISVFNLLFTGLNYSAQTGPSLSFPAFHSSIAHHTILLHFICVIYAR